MRGVYHGSDGEVKVYSLRRSHVVTGRWIVCFSGVLAIKRTLSAQTDKGFRERKRPGERTVDSAVLCGEAINAKTA